MAGIYNGHLIEFPQIRVDCFTSAPLPPRPPWLIPSFPNTSLLIPAPPAQLFLLTHVHSDHLMGLSNEFTGKIVCSGDTKRLLLNLEAEGERKDYYEGVKEIRRCKYEGLRAKVRGKGTKHERIEDRIEALPYNYPKEFELGYENGQPLTVSITLLEANHCPGSTMFLITSPDRAVLHTGDIRADNLFMQSLRRNPALGEFIVPWPGAVAGPSNGIGRGKGKGKERMEGGRRVLDRIYLDTSAVLGTGDMPDREPVLQDLSQQMSLYPDDTIFFLNVWCFGWEDVVKEVARHFNTLIHIDRYKASIYNSIKSDPFLSACTTLDHTVTRFHACERRFKCESCRTFDSQGIRTWNKDKRIVQVVMVEIKTAMWDVQHSEFIDQLGRAALGEGQWPFNIQCPIARHSILPELQNLVKLFRPNGLSPNTMVPDAHGLDFFLLPDFFKDHIQPAAYDQTIRERDAYFKSRGKQHLLDRYSNLQGNGVDLLANLGVNSGSERDDYMPSEDFAGLGGSHKIANGRKAAAQDQFARYSKLPSMGMGQILSVASKDQGVLKEISEGRNLRLTSMRRDVREEYSTDEDSPRRKKRWKVEGVKQVKVDSMDIQASPDLSIHGTGSASKEEEKPSLSPIVSNRTLRIPRLTVDKDHLRALAMVSYEPDES